MSAEYSPSDPVVVDELAHRGVALRWTDSGDLVVQLAGPSTVEVAAVAWDMLSRFAATGSGHAARVGQVQITKWRAVLEQSEPHVLVAEGAGPLLDPDCRDGKHTSCIGDPCECTSGPEGAHCWTEAHRVI
jgi:hypothetical protein